MRNYVFCIMVATAFLSLHAQQYAVKGKVIIENTDSVEASVRLMAQSGADVTSVQTRGGEFTFSGLAKGKDYSVVASRVGYASDTIRIEHIGKDLDLGAMFLRNKSVKLGEVAVVGIGNHQRREIIALLNF